MYTASASELDGYRVQAAQFFSQGEVQVQPVVVKQLAVGKHVSQKLFDFCFSIQLYNITLQVLLHCT